ncbi:hypothetical protein D9758_014517 [Tetrapyrgos nigripes]|uniref:HAT C-terminal dimerisation domain-containing protein n=1 Tax=Tetrapyrgos nigripes TaxID=182062 RepID=A0A8H5CTD5_9AGAR|nr:hypothetical protein D9758_014517 [Tetrapyrgos nigripes]
MYCSNNKKKNLLLFLSQWHLALSHPFHSICKLRTKSGRPASPVASKKHNRFDDLPALKPPKAGELGDELDRYLSADVEATDDVLGWWYGRKKDFPTLYRMGLDYLIIPATSTDVERVFSRGRFLLPYVRNRLSADTTRALMCLRQWSLMGLIQDEDVMTVAKLPEIEVSD